jgi:hypothetical protein
MQRHHSYLPILKDLSTVIDDFLSDQEDVRNAQTDK